MTRNPSLLNINQSLPPVPYMASAEWYATYAEALYRGCDETEARRLANTICAPKGMRDFARTCVADAGGADTLLSVALSGGGRAARNASPASVTMSLHGRWPHVHAGALSAAYGRSPYFDHFYPSIRTLLELVASAPEGSVQLSALSEALHEHVCDSLDLHGAIDALHGTSAEGLRRAGDEGRRSSAETLFRRSAIELMMRQGRRGALAILARVLPTILLFLTFAFGSGEASAMQSDTREPKVDVKVYTGYYRFVDEYGDTVRMTYIRDLYVYPPLKFKNKKQEEFYWRTVRDVRKTLPYAKLAFATLCETYEYIQTIPDKKQREAHLKRLEKDIFEEYKPVMKNMTKNQGKILLKLINRETDQSSYNIVKAFLGSFRAGFWQTFGRFFGMNMKAGFHPDKNDEDAIIERVATLIEQGTL